MCVPGCRDHVLRRLDRRRFFAKSGLVMAAGATGSTLAAPRAMAQGTRSFDRIVDLTHTLGADFPTFGGEPAIDFDQFLYFADDGYNMARWSLVEHVGTHMDAPIHFSADGETADEIPIEKLVVPLAIVDIREKAAAGPDAQVTPDDLREWEAANGPLPDGACVAMNSGWDAKVGSAEFRNADADGVMHFPGFHEDAARFLMDERQVVGIAVDTLSLDYGRSADFAVHYAWLPTNRWGMECVANLGSLPATGATIVAGGPKVAGATGGPSRVIALV
ncbi:MAG: cyclase family protein [Pseudomonadota bacterium]